MAPKIPPPDFLKLQDELNRLETSLDDGPAAGASLPIILFSAACGVGVGVVALYIGYRLLLLSLPLSVGLATLCMLGALSVTAGILSAAVRSNALLNVTLGCALVVISALFFAICSAVGALAAALMLNLQGAGF